MNYIYGREAHPNEKLIPLSEWENQCQEMKRLSDEIATAHAEMDKHGTVDKEFPLVMRVKGLVDRYAALADRYKDLKEKAKGCFDEE